MPPAPNLHPWLQKYQWLVIAMSGLHMGASALNSIARLQRGIGAASPRYDAYVMGTIFEVGIQGAAGFCLWVIVSTLMTSHSRTARILLGLVLAVYPCVCLMIPFNLVAGLVVIGSEIRFWRAGRLNAKTSDQ